MWYVEIIGPYDSTCVGPFSTEDDAANFEATVPQNFNSSILTEAAKAAKEAEYGPIHAEPPREAFELLGQRQPWTPSWRTSYEYARRGHTRRQ